MIYAEYVQLRLQYLLVEGGSDARMDKEKDERDNAPTSGGIGRGQSSLKQLMLTRREVKLAMGGGGGRWAVTRTGEVVVIRLGRSSCPCWVMSVGERLSTHARCGGNSCVACTRSTLIALSSGVDASKQTESQGGVMWRRRKVSPLGVVGKGCDSYHERIEVMEYAPRFEREEQ